MGNKLYVGNLSYGTTEDSLRVAFEAGGRQVARASVVTDRETGRSRGFGFVEMATAEDAKAAIAALDGTQLDGRAIKVNEARDRNAGGGGGGGGRERGGFRGGESRGGGGGRGGGFGGGGGRDRW